MYNKPVPLQATCSSNEKLDKDLFTIPPGNTVKIIIIIYKY